MKKLVGLFMLLLGLAGCQPKPVTPITSLINKVWKANTVKESEVLVFTLGATSNIKPGYTNFRLDLSKPDQVILKDVDGRVTTGTWSVSTDNKRLLLDNLTPKPTNTNGLIEYYILAEPDGSTLSLERTAESRKTGNTVNQYALIPE
ncbi:MULTISPECIES: hypothetical protein [unclassified Spirosoma]|uniref:hypothetical protein n=1 Tax=unclassified Spirosoma TaxID=2621999 RepID=UPI00095F5540|nr:MULTISPECIES: hypothetical protein [unclassified Spirosoma]MBN8826335.1 hypothetical protein [Spirosoma sp.]OJW76147.1 MAG: hypothetical protein BGO59_03200 [Spirosoma sp. 48-14]